ncbi:uncharacterized protein LOC133789514 isoform X1 [Humulus lupulus]|uniref:uncharacterized protein LOC133789514 isoform X1 n=1 Tax=Humulus lupulus TaxID=3486 RepID=UPI002B413292|nr:uncharacterized protein LOC133789514 isoform X1 [Humulus lupulus]
MSNSEDFGLTRYRGTERFYNPPAVRRYHESQKKHQPSPRRQLWKSLKYESRLDSSDAEARTDSEESTLSRPNSVSLPSSSSSSSSRDAASSNLDRIIESVTPYVKAQTFPEARMRGWSPEEAFYYLEDLWEAFREWSVYGVGVPLLLNGCDLVKQYYVPYLSGIQLYVNPQRLSDVGSGNWEAERWTNGVVVNRGQSRHNLMNLNAQMLYGLSLRDSHPFSPSSNSPGKPIYEYLETEPPYVRKPLYDQILNLASKFPGLNVYRSCDILPASWFSVAWYPIYRIPVGPTLQSLEASFLTFHHLSMHSPGKNQPGSHVAACARKGDALKISLPIFGLASYKLKDSILLPGESEERKQARALLLDAKNWLQCLDVKLPDLEFFQSRNIGRG